MPHGQLTAKKWLDSIEKQKRRIDLKERDGDKQTDRHLDRQTESTTKIIDFSRRGDQYIKTVFMFCYQQVAIRL